MDDDLVYEDFNPYMQPTEPRVAKSQHIAARQSQQEFFNMSIVQKTQLKELKHPQLKAAEIKREENKFKRVQSAISSVRTSDIKGMMDPAFHSNRREGVKSFIERQKEISRVIYNTAMKQQEIVELNKRLQQHTQELESFELKLSKDQRQCEQQGHELDDRATRDSKQNEESQHRLDEAKRKADELRMCMQTIMQEIIRESSQLDYALRCREMLELVGSHSSYAGEIKQEQWKRDVIANLMQENYLGQAATDDFDFFDAPDVQKKQPLKMPKGLKMASRSLVAPPMSSRSLVFPQGMNPQALVQQQAPGQQKKKLASNTIVKKNGSKSKEQDEPISEYNCLVSPYIIEHSKDVCQFISDEQRSKYKIDFDFKEFVRRINKIVKCPLQPKIPLSLQDDLDIRSLKLKKTEMMKEYEQKTKEILNIKLSAANIFERIDLSKPQNINPQLLKVIKQMRDSLVDPKIIFQSAGEYVQNLGMIENSNLIRTQHLQHMSEMIEKEMNKYQQNEAEFNLQQQELLTKINRYSEKNEQLVQHLSKQFDRESVENTIDGFIYNLDQYKSMEELIFDKYQTELDILHQVIGTAGITCQVISPEDLHLNSNTILAKMERLLIDSIVEVNKLAKDDRRGAELFRSKQKELNKIRKEAIRALRDREMLENNCKNIIRQQERDERSKKIVPIQKQVFVHAYGVTQKKTQKQLELEAKLKEREKRNDEDKMDFYAD
ncbi:Conserved_hypothetical protein [Hexamita inflata]|uniref:Uncharacterized protein n=1 Tax=Hexamita inflata TaxID=28002 RepID=A0AA86TRV0_9EUKA|nr:Conserved hypothetical protein [Hexamita inflata]